MLITLLAILFAALLLAMLSYTSWGQQSQKLLTSFLLYVTIGLIVGAALAAVGYQLARNLVGEFF